MDAQQTYRFFKTVQAVLIATLILTLPMNLFWQIDPNLGYYGGLRVDYLIPKIFLSDVVGILVIGCWLLVGLGDRFPSFAKGYSRAQQVSGVRKTQNEKLKTQNSKLFAASLKLQATSDTSSSLHTSVTSQYRTPISRRQTNNQATDQPSNYPRSTFHILQSIIHYPSIYLPILFLLLFARQFFTAVPMASVWFFLSTSLHIAVIVISYQLLVVSFNSKGKRQKANVDQQQTTDNSQLTDNQQLTTNNSSSTLHIPHSTFPHIIIGAVALSVLLQSSLGLYQFVTQHQLLPYQFLGEPQLSRDLGLSKANFAVVDRMLGTHLGYRILPYGTTPHPNVLGGWLAVGVIVISYQLLVISKNSKLKIQNSKVDEQQTTDNRQLTTSLLLATRYLLLTSAVALGFVTLLLTTSLSAVITFAMGVIVISYQLLVVRTKAKVKSLHPRRTSLGLEKAKVDQQQTTDNRQPTTQQRNNITTLLFLLAVIVTVPFMVHFANQWTNSSDASLRRRDVLSQLAVNAFVTHPVFGIGMNQSSLLPLQTDFNLQEVILFAQPIHNVPLLFLAENGLLGVAAIIVLGIHLASTKRYPKLVLFVILLPILTLDHYLYTLSVGQGIWLVLLLSC